MSLRRSISLLLLAPSVFATLLQAPVETQSFTQSKTASQEVAGAWTVGAFGQRRLNFEANRGQVADGRTKFISRGHGYSLHLGSTEAVLILTEPIGGANTAVVHMTLVGGSADPQVVGQEQLSGVSRYFGGSDPGQWLTDVPNYAKVEYRNIYPGVDLVYYGNQGNLEYDFVVSPGTDPGVIRLAFDGVDTIEVDDRGDLVLGVGHRAIRQRKPFAYQEHDGVRREVASRYRVQDREVRFELGPYTSDQPLVIDPVLI